MRSRWPARIVISGSRFRYRSSIEVALPPSPCPTPARSPYGEAPASVRPLSAPTAPAAANVER